MGVLRNLGQIVQSFLSPEEAATKQMERERGQSVPRKGHSGQRTNFSRTNKWHLEQDRLDHRIERQKEWLTGLTESQLEEWRHESLQSIGKPIPSNDDLVDAAKKRAERMRDFSKDLEIPFTPLEEPFELDGLEQQCTQIELNGSGLSEDNYDEETWQGIVLGLYVPRGLHMAVEARFRDGDYTGALRSWIRWISISSRATPIEMEGKEEWLLLARIYVGVGRMEDAKKALAWAEAAKEAEDPPDPETPWTNQFEEYDWNKQVSGVLQQIDRPSA